MRLYSMRGSHYIVIGACALAVAACQTRRPEPPVMADTPPPAVAQPGLGAPTTPPPTTQAPPVTTPPAVQQPGIGPGSIQDFVINVGDRVYFDLDRFDIRADAEPVLNAQAAWLNRYPQVTIRIEGNADERGTREYNFALGERRANSVRDYLIRRGVAANRISTVSYGKERPIDPGSGEAAWQRNRNAHTAITGGAQ